MFLIARKSDHGATIVCLMNVKYANGWDIFHQSVKRKHRRAKFEATKQTNMTGWWCSVACKIININASSKRPKASSANLQRRKSLKTNSFKNIAYLIEQTFCIFFNMFIAYEIAERNDTRWNDNIVNRKTKIWWTLPLKKQKRFR